MEKKDLYSKIAAEQSIALKKVEAVVALLEEDATIPFIARYRKEATGSLDEVQIAAIRDRLEQLKELEKRRESILKSMLEMEKLTDELKQKIETAATLTELEDIYLPYKPKRKTKASMAREKGLQPLADLLFEQRLSDIESEAVKFIDSEKGVNTIAEALSGARDIVAELVNEDPQARASVRELFFKEAVIRSNVITGKEEEAQKYKDYFDWQEPVANCPSHRLLAMRRAEKEGLLTLNIRPNEETALAILEKQFLRSNNQSGEQVKLAIKESYKRLLSFSLETELRIAGKDEADKEAVRVFAENLRQLLLAAPFGEKRVLAIDPGFRTGCKLVCLDEQGKLLYNTTIYPVEPQKKLFESGEVIKDLISRYQIEAIAIGNGTASRETESFVRGLGLNNIQVIMVNEAGASVYSASEAAREEFPDHDITVRGSVSIGRRLKDPLAELVKIDPKSIGVGQYQHDVNQLMLKKSLDDTVISCVNAVGVEVNSASKQLLSYVSGLSLSLAQNIVEYRNNNGAFKSRNELKKVSRLGDKAFEQAAGFLRIRNAENPLDASAVHPETYPIVEKMATDLDCSINDLTKQAELRKKIDLKKYVTDTVGLPTLQDILKELDKPGRDPREVFETFSFAEGIHTMNDLKPGMKLPGIVTNLTKFGVFVDIGVHQDGLIHISNLANRFISDATEVVKVQQKVEVTVLEVDIARKRIALSMKDENNGTLKPKKEKTVSSEKEPATMQDALSALKKKFGK